MIDFSNTQTAFEGKSDADLKSAELLFRAMASNTLVKTGKLFSNVAASIHFPIGWALRPTIYKHFVGGESLQDTHHTLEKLGTGGVSAVLDYSAEGGSSEKDINATYEETLRSLHFAKGNPHVSHGVFKPSGVGPVSVLEKLTQGKALTAEEEKRAEAFRKRFMELCRLAHEHGTRILIDAEHYAYQGIVDELSIEAMSLFNKERAIVFATLQMYRHDRLALLERIDARAREEGFIPGIKFVRGAYMEEERMLAQKNGYPDPICKDKQATDDNYNAGVRFVLERIDHFELFVGTHNEKSLQLATKLAEDLGIRPDDKRVFFAQLYGMSDNLSFNLAKAGYNVTKYLPYAPVDKVLPYLIRRAEENTAIKGQTTRELQLIRTERERRRNARK
ncbi:proline dehydrogenase family protein [Porphyromonas sp.]|uniref:proline dehydrogenase family protein n=1 Tax=Porphyromonas sp. TaxID=1924944 RepID=UPI0026DD7EDE|nr:proline dehydrogenase family protein [Porphyromonas sp.]MDO4771343.1 proline dehydrogenase family protein [Porphyromonas sp.]